MNKILTLIQKEWAEVFRNRMVLLTVILMPLIFIILPFATLYGTSKLPVEDLNSEMDELPGNAITLMCEGLDGLECMQIYMLNLFGLFYLIIPVIVPVTIAAYSIVGEKTARSLEPLLATPITTAQLLLAKILAAALPAIGATWLAYAIFLVTTRFFVSAEVFSRVAAPLWIVAVLVVGPLLSLLAVNVAVMISSRATDPRVAEQTAGIVALPLILVLVGQSVGFILINQRVVLIFGFVVAVVDVALTLLAISLFERENILTRWK